MSCGRTSQSCLSSEFAMQMLPRVQITIFLHVLPVAGCPARLREDEERDAAISAGGWETKQIKFPQSLFGTFWHQADPFETSLYLH